MIVQFTVGNFLSFRDKVTFSLQAAAIKEYVEANLFVADRQSLLKGAIVYGANASGKSNFIRAMSTMRRLVLNSFEQSSVEDLEITPFLLNAETDNAYSFFEIIFLIEGIQYRYGFEADNRTIGTEWLFKRGKAAEKPLFLRQEDGIHVMPRSFPEGKNLEEKTRANALFLAVVDQFNGQVSRQIMQWFQQFITVSGLSHERYKAVTFELLENSEVKPMLLDFYKRLDLGFEDIQVNKIPFHPKDLPSDIPDQLLHQLTTDLEGAFRIEIKTVHPKYDPNGVKQGSVAFDMRTQESSGTNKLFNISGPVFDVLRDGGVLIIDEMDASLHPLLTLSITKLFHSTETNPKNAQLILATHDTNLLYYGNYRRDQVYFVEKDRQGASTLYSLVEYKEHGKTIRKDRSFEKDYIEGRYGAIPYINNLSNSTLQWQEK